MSRKLTWCCRADECILQISGTGCTRKKNCKVYKIFNERSGAVETLWSSAAQRQQYRKVKHHSNHPDERSFSAYCQAAHFSHVFSTCWAGCVLVAESLQGSNGTEPRPPFFRRSWLGCFVSHQSANVVFIYVQTNQAKGEMPPPSYFRTMPPISPGVKAPKKNQKTKHTHQTALRCKENSLKPWLLSNNIFYFFSCFYTLFRK